MTVTVILLRRTALEFLAAIMLLFKEGVWVSQIALLVNTKSLAILSLYSGLSYRIKIIVKN